MATCNCIGSLCGKCICACACTCNKPDLPFLYGDAKNTYWQRHSMEAFLHNTEQKDSIFRIADLIGYKRESLEDILPELPKE